MSEFSTTENNFPTFPIPTKDLDIKLLSIWLFRITDCTHVKGEREGIEGLQTVRLPYFNPLSLPLFSCCLIFFYFSQFPSFKNAHLPIFPLLSFASLSSAYFPGLPSKLPPLLPPQPSSTLNVCNGY